MTDEELPAAVAEEVVKRLQRPKLPDSLAIDIARFGSGQFQYPLMIAGTEWRLKWECHNPTVRPGVDWKNFDPRASVFILTLYHSYYGKGFEVEFHARADAPVSIE